MQVFLYRSRDRQAAGERPRALHNCTAFAETHNFSSADAWEKSPRSLTLCAYACRMVRPLARDRKAAVEGGMRERRWALGSTRPRRAARDRAETAIYQRKRAPPLGALPRTRVDGSSVELAGAGSTYRFIPPSGTPVPLNGTRCFTEHPITRAPIRSRSSSADPTEDPRSRSRPCRRPTLHPGALPPAGAGALPRARAYARGRPYHAGASVPVGPDRRRSRVPVPRSRTRPIASSTELPSTPVLGSAPRGGARFRW